MPTEDLSAAQRLKETADQLFFIVGCGRSGTSLLQAMISSHPVAIIPNETKFYTVIHKHYRAPSRHQILLNRERPRPN